MGYIQGLSASSTMNFTFGGTQEGWMGLKSTPKTDALGYSSPTGRVSIERDVYGWFTVNSPYSRRGEGEAGKAAGGEGGDGG